MRIEINNQRKIFAIQEEFKNAFPNLKIEFYEKPSKPGGSASGKKVKSSSKTLAECRAVHNSGSISVLPGMTASELNQNFRDVYGLTTIIFQESRNNKGDISPMNEKVTLEELNREVPKSS